MVKLRLHNKEEFVEIDGKKVLCDGKICGQGKNNRGKKVCPHNNLRTKFPELVKEWDYEKNDKNPEAYTSGSGKKIWWKCRSNTCNCHNWPATISSRTRKNPSGCPFCKSSKICPHNNLAVKFPDLIIEFDRERNSKSPEEYSKGSDEVAWWKCRNDICGCHRWPAAICDRTKENPTGCPYCNSGKLCPHNNFAAKFPDLVTEFDRERNPKSPDEYTKGSDEIVWWKCRKNPCGCHAWQTSICGRTKHNSTGCPFAKKIKYVLIII